MRWTYKGRLSGLIGSKLDIDFRRVRRKCCSYQKRVLLFLCKKQAVCDGTDSEELWFVRTALDYTVFQSLHDAMVSAPAFCYNIKSLPEDQIS